MSSPLVVARFLALTIVFLISAPVSTSTPVHATVLEAQGGPGGGRFSAQCPSGQFLVGVSIKSGAWVDAIYTLCAPFLADGRFGKRTRGARHGGAGGSALLKDAVCPSDRVVSGITFGWTRTEYAYVDYVELKCLPLAGGQSSTVCVHTGHGCWNKHPNPPPPTFPGGLSVIGDEPFRQDCPINPKLEVATGIHGRSGAYVDALGLICGPQPKPVVASPAPPPPPAVEDPAAPPVEVGSADKPRANFSGIWDSVAGKDGTHYRLDLGQQGTLVKGSYQPGDGRISGRVNGNQLIFNWSQPGSKGGTGRFEMLDPKNKTFRGEYFIKGQQGLAGYWGGARP